MTRVGDGDVRSIDHVLQLPGTKLFVEVSNLGE